MIRVTKASFFAIVGSLNVHPNIVGPWDSERGYRSDWEMQDGSRRRVGMSYGNGVERSEYLVEPGFYAANSAALTLA